MTQRKKKILIVSSSLNTGGLEKCLVNFCNALDKSQYEIDLYLFNEGRALRNELKDGVNLLPEFSLYYDVFNCSIFKGLINLAKKGQWKLFAYKTRRFIRTRFKRNLNTVKDWQYMQKAMIQNGKQYDVAIGFEEGTACYYVADCINAKVKLGWIHTDIKMINSNEKLDNGAFEKLNYICTVSQNSLKSLGELYPNYLSKMKCFCLPAMLDYEKIDKLALEPCDEFSNEYINILSVGRLVELKGFHLCIEPFSRLIKDGYKVKWYVAGDGDYREMIEQQIAKYNVQDHFILLGNCSNPYKYINSADICVQPSSYEGFGMAVWEEKYLKKPVIATTIPSHFEIINDGENGLLVERNSEEIYKALKVLVNDKNLRERMGQTPANGYDSARNTMTKIEELF